MVSKSGKRVRRMVHWRSIVAGAVLALAVPWLVFEVVQLNNEQALNHAVARGSFDDLAQRETPLGWFARAYIAQNDGRLDEALAGYAAVGDSGDPRFDIAMRFNLANLFLQQAVTFEGTEKKPLMLSLIEQAKQNYREVLASDPQHWPSRYNLSRALEMLPDLDDVHYGDEINPERSPQAPKVDNVYERLP